MVRYSANTSRQCLYHRHKLESANAWPTRRLSALISSSTIFLRDQSYTTKERYNTNALVVREESNRASEATTVRKPRDMAMKGTKRCELHMYIPGTGIGANCLCDLRWKPLNGMLLPHNDIVPDQSWVSGILLPTTTVSQFSKVKKGHYLVGQVF